jgi:hypothetical protein
VDAANPLAPPGYLCVDVAVPCDSIAFALVERNHDGTIVIVELYDGRPTEEDIAASVKKWSLTKAAKKTKERLKHHKSVGEALAERLHRQLKRIPK